jgi:hypothetical protein
MHPRHRQRQRIGLQFIGARSAAHDVEVRLVLLRGGGGGFAGNN